LKTAKIEIRGMLGQCGGREVFLGFASARKLAGVSFPDVLDEATGKGYQRRFHREHSLEFKKYIQKPGASTIPLTFNLRAECSQQWDLERASDGGAVLRILDTHAKVMAQVDCQHRLGYLGDSDTPFAFMTFIGLSVTEEMDVFRVINGKAKGLSGSLLDFTEARLSGASLKNHKLELFLALQLQEDERSPWYGRLDLGGNPVSGNSRRASLRTMEHAAKRFLREAKPNSSRTPESTVGILIDFWKALALVLKTQWSQPRQHMIIKGIGVYSLMSMAGLLTREAEAEGVAPELDYFITKLSNFIDRIDWSNEGPLKGFGGASGADAAFALLLQERSCNSFTTQSYGKEEHSVN
jgi:DGQHR domain-containing protein